MSDDPSEYLEKAGLSLDAVKINDAIRLAVDVARTDPFTGLGSAVGMGVGIRDLISNASALSKIGAGISIDPAFSLASLSAFRSPYTELSVLGIADQYQGTINSLASVAGVAESMRSAFPSVSAIDSITSSTAPWPAPARSAGIADALSWTSNFAPASVSAGVVDSARWTVPTVSPVSTLAATLHGSPLNAGFTDALSLTRSNIEPAYLSSAATFAPVSVSAGVVDTARWTAPMVSPVSTLAATLHGSLLNAGPTDALSLTCSSIAPAYLSSAATFAPVSVSAGVVDTARWTAPMVSPVSTLTATLHGSLLNAGLTDALSLTRSIAPAYFSSAASVFSLESVVARATLSGTGSLFASTFLSGTTLDSLARIDSTVSSLSIATKAVWDRIGLNSSVLEVGPVEMWRAPALELYASAHTAAAICFRRESLPAADEEIEEELGEAAESIELRLAQIDGDLVEVYRGGVMAIESGLPDWQRHSMTSFRELSTQVLHKLAPDKAVIDSGGELHQGRPTRRARLTFIFSNVAGGEFTEFFEADMKTALKLFDLLNGNTHRLGSKATPDQVRWLKLRLTGLIGSMLSARGY